VDSRSLPKLACVALLVASSLVARVSFAEVTAAEKANARELMDRGDDLVEKKQYREALEAYQAADAIMHVPTTGIEVARAQVALGLLVEARETALEVARSPETPGEPAPFAEARDAARQLATALERRIPTLRGERQADSSADRAEGASWSSLRPALLYGGFGVGAVGVLVGSITGLVSIAETSSVKAQCAGNACPLSSQGGLSSARGFGVASDVFFGLGIAGAGVGLVTLVASKPTSKTTAAARVVLSPQSVLVLGEF
jgi:hypothetical protein